MDKKLTLVGIVHTDPNGEIRLVRAVDKLKPKYLTVEADENCVPLSRGFVEDIVSFLGNDDTLKLHEFQLKTLKNDLHNYGFETKVASNYKKTGTPKVLLIDENVPQTKKYQTSKNKTSDIPNVVREHNELAYSTYQYLSQIKGLQNKRTTAFISHYLAISCFNEQEREVIINHKYNEPINNISPTSEQRDEIMGSKIRNLWNETDGDIMHVGGIEHLFGNYNNLYEILKDINPTRYKLNEIE